MKKYTTIMESVPPEITPNHIKLIELKGLIRNKDISGVKRMLDSGVDVDDLTLKPHSLLVASEYNNDEIFELILNHVKNINAVINEYGENLLFPIARQGRVKYVKLLLGRHIDLNHVNGKGDNIILHLSDKDSNASLIRLLCMTGNRSMVNFENINSGMTPIVNACLEGKLDIVQLLIKLGAKKDYQNDKITTPLIASVGNSFKVFEYLLDEGADPNIPDHTGQYPIFRIIYVWGDALMKILLSKQTANPNVVNSSGDTPLLVLVKNNRYSPEMFQLLVEYGADLEAKDRSGKTVWDIAEENDRDRYLKVLFHADMIRNREYHNPLK